MIATETEISEFDSCIGRDISKANAAGGLTTGSRAAAATDSTIAAPQSADIGSYIDANACTFSCKAGCYRHSSISISSLSAISSQAAGATNCRAAISASS